MSLYSSPPPLGTPKQDKPTLLVCWWITLFCTTIILFRIAGRFIRSEKLFREDKTAALAIIPLYLRMGCVHVILIWGTNNAQFTQLTDHELHMKTIASGLVLASRIFYAATYVSYPLTPSEIAVFLRIKYSRLHPPLSLAKRFMLTCFQIKALDS